MVAIDTIIRIPLCFPPAYCARGWRDGKHHRRKDNKRTPVPFHSSMIYLPEETEVSFSVLYQSVQKVADLSCRALRSYAHSLLTPLPSLQELYTLLIFCSPRKSSPKNQQGVQLL